ncbi:hypothetical protein N7462_005742 [Penicillium macrosclerotiorum]|uniref:uncharacterized protein n=1 Tax=Penicillium macrosclerotiorum TaxID=303699 RepID=UPI002548C44D|nr:uncharacterized protein N7462_005742 [Penicillium macrosclerotiorum]KAJ5682577.1 hypothetical protein N7462_005742 [Penicillium macrosclerotiorum]
MSVKMAGESKIEDQPEANIIVAADHGRLDLVTTLLEGVIDPNTVDEVGTSALHNAANKGHWHIARLLLEKNASPRIRDGKYAIPVHLAVKAGHQQIVRLLLECDPGISDTKQIDQHKLLRLAAGFGHIDIVQLLLNHGASSLSTDGRKTPLHWAAKKGHADVCELLLKHDKNLDRSLWARPMGPSLEVDAKDMFEETPFTYACQNKHKRTVEIFLRQYSNLYKTYRPQRGNVFHDAIRTGDIEMAGIFLNHGADIEMKDNKGRRAIHVAVSADTMGFVDTSYEMIQLILAHGATVDVKDENGHTPESYTSKPRIRMLLRTSKVSKGESVPVAPQTKAPPPEYKN